MNMPNTLEQINRELRLRWQQGLTVDIIDIGLEVLRDDDIGLFARVTIVLNDHSSFTIDTIECQDILQRAQVH